MNIAKGVPLLFLKYVVNASHVTLTSLEKCFLMSVKLLRIDDQELSFLFLYALIRLLFRYPLYHCVLGPM